MLQIVELGRRGRQIKFTPERIEQIKNLVERGKSREEIAELIGVTVGSLQVTCSRLGISLRRPIINNGIRPRLKPVSTLPSKPAKAADMARFAISMQYRGEERTTELLLTHDMVTQLAVEAAFRGMPIGDLIGDLIVGALQAHARKEAAPAEARPPCSPVRQEHHCERHDQHMRSAADVAIMATRPHPGPILRRRGRQEDAADDDTVL
jgi:hypothetical protein